MGSIGAVRRLIWPAAGCLIAIVFCWPTWGSVSVQIGNNFTGATLGVDSDALPPDCDGMVGPTHFVQFINGRYTVFDKTAGTNVQTMTELQFWAKAGVALGRNLAASDPRILFDPSSQRWFACQVDVNQATQITNRFLLAVSQTADPTRPWTGFAFRADPQANTFADFPTLGIDDNGVYLGAEVFDHVGNDVGPILVMVPKAGLLDSLPTVTDRTYLGSLPNGAVPQPAITLGTAGSGEAVLAIGDLGQDSKPHSSLAAYTVHAGAGPGLATVSFQAINVPSYSVPINPPQPNGLHNLDNGDARFSASVYRVNDVLYAVHSTQVNSHAAIQWFKIDALTFSVLQTEILTDPNLDLFFPSIAANSSGIVVLAFNGSSLDSYVTSYARVGETIDGQVVFGATYLLKAGLASFSVNDSSGTSRWGDYSATSVDPLQPNHFWTIQAIPSKRSTWATQITELIVGPDLSLALSIVRGTNNVQLSWSTNAAAAQLEFTPALSGTNDWASVTAAATVVSNLFQLTVPAGTRSQGFYRLIQR
jgi:hypothetical protein